MPVRRNQYREQKLDLRVALHALQAAGRPLRSNEFVSELVDMFNCSERVARDAIRILRMAGYLDTSRDDADGRRRLLAISEAGAAVAAAPNGDQLLRFARRLYTSSPSPTLARWQERILERGGPGKALDQAEKRLLTAEPEPDLTPTSQSGPPTKRRRVNPRLQKLASGSNAGRPLNPDDLELILEQANYEAARDLLDRQQQYGLIEPVTIIPRVRRAVDAGVVDVTIGDLWTLSDVAPSPIGRMIYDTLFQLHALRILVRCLLTPAEAAEVLVADSRSRQTRDQERRTGRSKQTTPTPVAPVQNRVPEVSHAIAAYARFQHDATKIHLDSVEDLSVLLAAMHTLDESQIDLIDAQLALIIKTASRQPREDASAM